ncbi:MAG TPA: winged helix-turn-helix domain-containing protein [Sphingomonadales bacterium]|nr:winged helix-turn-helix domain-containing protein [Sphingomonadales bacterium]
MQFMLGPWRVDAGSNELRAKGRIVKIEDRAMRVLAYLYQHRDRVVSKDELLDTVWGRSAISEHSVAIVISDLRKALGDDTKNPRILKTIPKKGYQLLVPGEGKRLLSPWAILVGMAAALILTVTLARFLQDERLVSVTFRDLRSENGSKEAERLAADMTGVLLAELTRSPHLELVRIREPERASERSASLLQSLLGGRKLRLDGVLAEEGNHFILSLALEDGTNAAVGWGFSEEVYPGQILITARAAARQLFEHLGLEAPAFPPAVSAETERAYWRALYLWDQRAPEETRAGFALLRDLVAANPGFALGHAALANIYAHKTAPYLGLENADLFALAENEIRIAASGNAELPELEIAKALVAFYRDRNYEGAFAILDRAARRWPSNALLWQTQAMALSAMGRGEESLYAIDRARRLDPLSHSINWDRVWFLYLAGQYQDAQAAGFETAVFTSDVHHHHMALIYEALGDREAAFDEWVAFLNSEGIPTPPASEMRAAAGTLEAAYQSLMALKDASAQPVYPEGVRVFWLLGAGDPEAARSFLDAMPVNQENWVFYWRDVIPLFGSSF